MCDSFTCTAKVRKGIAVSLLLRNRKALIAQVHDTLNRHDFETAAQLFVERERGLGIRSERQEYLKRWQDIYKTFPDMTLDTLETIADEDWIVTQCLFSGAHRGVSKVSHHSGVLLGVPATGRLVALHEVHFYRITNGKIAEHYAHTDDVTLMRQLGLLKPLEVGV
jgi:predicted ester cyclase